MSIKTNNTNNKKNDTLKDDKSNKRYDNIPVIQLPSVNMNNIPFTPNRENQNNNNITESKESPNIYNNMKSAFTESNVVILPEISPQKSSRDIINNSPENKRYLLFQKNNNKDSKINKSIKFNNNIISFFDDKIKNKKNQQLKNSIDINRENTFNKRNNKKFKK